MEKNYVVLIVDDLKENRLLLRKIIESIDYNVQEAANGKEGLEIARLHKPDLIISDILMPVMDGFRFCREVKKDDKLKNIPFIFYTATYTSKKDEEFALKLGAEKFIIKPLEPVKFIKIIQSIFRDVKKGMVKLKEPALKEDKEVFKLYNERLVNKLEKKMLDLEKEITERKQAEEKVKNSLKKLKQIIKGTIHAMAYTVEVKDPYTAGHQRRVTNLAFAVATKMNLSKNQIEGIRMAGVVHDIGKIYVPAEILSKPGRLNEIEFNMIKTHAQVGYDILKTIEFPLPIAQIVYQHHERMNNSGYPQGLSGNDILMEARIIGVADVVEAMSSHRPYRPALGIDKAIDEIKKNKGILYDPEVVDACLIILNKKEFEFEEL